MESEFPEELQTQAYGILSSNDVEPMETLFSHLFGSQEPHRSQAYTFLHCCKKHFPHLLFIKLFFVIRWSPVSDHRSRSALVLRYVKVCDLWPKLSSIAQHYMKSHILVCLQEEVSMPTLRLICGIVSEMGSEISKAGSEWPELTEFLLNSIQSDYEKLQQSALWVLAYLPKGFRPVVCEALVPSLATLHSRIKEALSSPNADIQVTAFGAVVSLIGLFTNSKGRNWFNELLRAMMVGLFELLSHLKEEYARGAVNELIMLVMDGAHILKPYLNHLVLDMLNVLECKKVTDETKLFVDKFLLAMAEATELAPMMRELPHETMVRLLTTSVQLLLSIKDDSAWYNMESELCENDGNMDVYKSGILFLKKLSAALGEKRILPICFEMFLEHMDATEWKKRHAGISLLAVIAEECSDEMVLMKDCLDQVIAIILKSFKDPHPRVCWAAFRFMQQSTNLVQAMQILYHSRIVYALDAALDQHQNIIVKEQVVSALKYLLKNVPLDSLRMHTDLDTILWKLQIEP
ncbi:importin subunit beta-3-like [Argentina anserina]|uniref:importin subunit beta-3-like n=1 Tax=Argentina anserina TaxID=57926 RepID=UPI0021765DAD|nr:importin subunit beta-3-like [Potentilla anserina]